MIQGMYTSATGMITSQTYLDVSSNNLANLDTTAYKNQQITFQDLFYQTVGTTSLTNRQQVGFGDAVASITGLFTQGPITPTGRALDVAVQGIGFFQVTDSSGNTFYTRDGNFNTDSAGNLVTAGGLQLVPPVTVPADALSVTITASGAVLATTQGSPTIPVQIGQLQLTQFANTNGLARVGSNLFTTTPATGQGITGNPGTNGLGVMVPGALEGSNTNSTTELINLLIAQQSFTFNSRAFQVSNELAVSTLSLLP